MEGGGPGNVIHYDCISRNYRLTSFGRVMANRSGLAEFQCSIIAVNWPRSSSKVVAMIFSFTNY